jgi:hypothetical protein
MGTLLRVSKKVTFQSLSEIKESYEKAFWEHGDNIFLALGDPTVDELSIARNVIVHRVGECDDAYGKRAGTGKCPHLPKRRLGERLHPDGHMVRDILPAAMAKGEALLRSVDAWLIGHKQKDRTEEGQGDSGG